MREISADEYEIQVEAASAIKPVILDIWDPA